MRKGCPMSGSKTAGLVAVVAVLAAAIGLKWWQQAEKASTPPNLPKACNTCITPPKDRPGVKREPPRIPTGSGRPCLVEFGSTECTECKKLHRVLAAVNPRLKGRVDIVVVDVDEHPELADKWRLRVIPTQIFLDKNGQEVGRHEGALSEQELFSKLRELRLPSAAQSSTSSAEAKSAAR